MEKYRSRKAIADEVRKEIIKAAGAGEGIKPLTWHGVGRGQPCGGIHDLQGYSAYPGELPADEFRVPAQGGGVSGQSGASEDVICAALLHDAIEDQKIPAALIASMFGAAVAAMVEEVTDNKELPTEARQYAQIVHAPHLSPGAKLIKLADKISNLNSLISSPPVEWTTEKRLAYVEFCRNVVARLRGANTMLEELFDEAAEAAREAHQHAA